MHAWLFDLDGTLVDTVGELANAFNATFEQFQLPTHPISTFRPIITEGVAAILRQLTQFTDEDHIQEMKNCIFDYYQKHLGEHSWFFSGISAILDKLDQQAIPWGIVTNKHERFAYPLLAKLQLDKRTQCIVCGDSLPHHKPHPAPLLHASDLLNTPAKQCVYVGDSHCDVQAAKAAAMKMILVSYGYHCKKDDITSWGANWIIDDAAELINWIDN